MLQNLINSLNREQLLACLNDPSVTDASLKAAVMHCATNGAANGATAPTVAPVTALPALAPTPAASKSPKAPKAPGLADTVVAGLAATGQGFAVAHVIAGGGKTGDKDNVTRSQASSAIKRAVKAGTLFAGGAKRFTRYANSAAVAVAASTAARG